MPSTQEFMLPDVGEGLTEAEIVAWRVAVGDRVEVNDVIVDIETAKSVVELPCPFAGVVTELHAAEGETVEVGAPLLSVSGGESGSAGEGDEDRHEVLVGPGPKPPSARKRRIRRAETSSQPARPLAKPPARLLARQLGVDLSELEPQRADGVITRDDVLRATEGVTEGVAESDHDSGTRIPIKGVRKHTAAAMVKSAFTAPHVTEFITVDVTKTMELRDSVLRRPEFRDVKLSPLAFVARAYLRAIATTPMATAFWDEATSEIVVPDEVNLGIAAATPRGLVVPNIKSAHLLGLRDLAVAIEELAVRARAGKTSPGELAGGNTTLTNIGVFGVDSGTPILNPGESTILAVGAVRRQPWVVGTGSDERIEARSILQLALSFDHRVLDGAEGSRLLADTAALLAEPGLAML